MVPVRRQPQPQSPPVGVLAATQNLATSLARELNIHHAIALGSSSTGRGIHLKALIVDESVNFTKELEQQYLPCLQHHAGYILRVSRCDPKVGG